MARAWRRSMNGLACGFGVRGVEAGDRGWRHGWRDQDHDQDLEGSTQDRRATVVRDQRCDSTRVRYDLYSMFSWLFFVHTGHVRSARVGAGTGPDCYEGVGSKLYSMGVVRSTSTCIVHLLSSWPPPSLHSAVV